jgi:EAL domain-containing protein (putative c-di-GMP-specific phosphodiesterase class I)
MRLSVLEGDLPPASGPLSLGEAFPQIGRLFSACGAMGALVVDASGLAGIERSYGAETRDRVFATLAELVVDHLGDALGAEDRVLLGETGRSEVLVLLFRGPGEVAFYTRDLDQLQVRLQAGIEQRGSRVAYPYVRELPTLHVGSASTLRNPLLGADTQILGALEQAREHARISARLASRLRRKRLFDLVVEGRVRSVYEPIVEVQSHTVFGYEALARGPEDSELHSPARLFATASEQDLLFELDCLCRKSGLDGARDLPGDAKLFLNIRPTTIHDPSFRAEVLERTLERCGLCPSDVVLEISEQESIDNFEIFREVRDYYGKLGFQIALDDTGSGYASLKAVVELSPEFIKVDRAFVSRIDEDPGRQEILSAFQSVAQRIGARIIGEGLDTLEELETLGRLGIPFGQGWLFGKPHPLRSDT